jgi:hypothetical protein
LFLIAITLLPAGDAAADRLVLKDGRELRGDARREGDTWTIVTDTGETLTFSKSEVKRHHYASRVTPLQAAEMFREYAALVEQVLNAPVPEQYVWLREITEQAGSYRYAEDTGRVTYRERLNFRTGQFSGGTSGTASIRSIEGGEGSEHRTESKTLRDKGIDNVFVEDWAHYVGKFESLAADLRYKELVRRGKYSGSLYDFAMWPPAGYEREGQAIKQALDSVQTAIELAVTTQNMVAALPTQHWRLQDEINRAYNDLEEARSRLRDADERHKDARRTTVRERESRLRDKIAKMNRDIPRSSTNAERRINDLARQREITRGAIARASSAMGAVLSDVIPMTPSPSQPTRSLEEAIEEANRLILRHRERARNLTTLGLDQLRAESDAALHALFEGQDFRMGLYLQDTRHSESGGYELTAATRPADQPAPPCLAHLKFGDELRSRLVMCPKGAALALVARVQSVRRSAPWSELEANPADPQFVIFGAVQSVESDCG